MNASHDETAPSQSHETPSTPDVGESCEIPSDSPLSKLLKASRKWQNPDEATRKEILRKTQTIAIIGASENPARASYDVSQYLLSTQKYELFFVNPHSQNILGQTVYSTLSDIPVTPDLVVAFRKSEDIPSVVSDVLSKNVQQLWIQLGIWNEAAARLAQESGVTVVMDRCIKIDHIHFNGA